MNSLASNENIETFSPGSEIKTIGILKKLPKYKQGKELLYSDYIFEIIDAEQSEKEIDLEEISDEEIDIINEISAKVDENGLDTLCNSFSPDVYGLEHVKKAIMMQLANKRNIKRGNTERNKSNILLIGDPGSAKTVVTDFALRISTGSRKAIGGSSSAVGITASVVKDEDDLGGYRVEPGAMVLAKDTFVLDEMNNLNDEDKPKIQEGMESQTITVNKATIHAIMPVTCGNIGIANPKYGHFKEDAEESIQEQFNIPTPILNRFDTVFVVRDYVDYNTDKLIAKRMLKRKRGLIKPEYGEDILKKYFAFVKQQEDPGMTDEIEDFFAELYAKSRPTYNQGVKINPRFISSLSRMAIACAKMRLSNTIEEKDIKRAFEVLSESQYKVSEGIILDLLKEEIKQ